MPEDDKKRTVQQQLRDMEEAFNALPEDQRPDIPDIPDTPEGESKRQSPDAPRAEGPRVEVSENDLSGESTNQILSRILTAIEQLPRDIVDELTG